VWNVTETETEICLDNSCKGVISGNTEYVPGQRLQLKVGSSSSEDERAYFSVVGVSQ
jgi:hypothetical protein